MKTLILFSCFLSFYIKGICQFFIQEKSDVVVSANTILSFNNVDVINNGVFSADKNSEIFFTGNKYSEIGGKEISGFASVSVDKGFNSLGLAQHLYISDQINFLSGYIDLNRHNILLASTATLNNENEQSHIVGKSGGYISITVPGNTASVMNPGNLGIEIKDGTESKMITVKRNHEVFNLKDNKKSISRNYQLKSESGDISTSILRFHFFDAELNESPKNELLFGSTANGNWKYSAPSGRDNIFNYVENNKALPAGILTLIGNMNDLSFNNNNTDVSEQSGSIRLYPNPARDIIHIALPSSFESSGKIMITDAKGALVLLSGNEKIIKEKILTFSVSMLSPGAYRVFLKDKSGKLSRVLSFVKQ